MKKNEYSNKPWAEFTAHGKKLQENMSTANGYDIKSHAINLLGKYAYDTTGKRILNNRILRMQNFIQQYPDKNIKISINNNWSKPKNYRNLLDYKLIGGTTYQYMVWAVIEK